ncbi:MAG: hypothetical protein LBT09_13175 [Planctomycetaceae bacterium]|jgi:hypothetical protein|nr:hypothetical protein [Planctomycetaceae bacterium]
MKRKERERDISTIVKLGIGALNEKLGPIATTKFMLYFNHGRGDYTKERHQWLDRLSEDDVYEDIEAGIKLKRKCKGCAG